MSVTDIGAALSNSLSFSSLLVLTAIGLAITFGVMRVINMAHGEMLMLGGYTAHVVSSLLPRWLHEQGLEGPATHLGEFGLYYAIPISFVTVGLATGLAGVAGCIVGNVYNVNYLMGTDYIVESFMVVILGGMGRLGGTIAAAALIGFSLQFLEKFLSNIATPDTISSPAITA